VKKNTLWKMGCALFVFCAVTAIASSAQTLTTLMSFNGFDGSEPYFSPLIQGTDGNFYGTTAYGGANCSPSGCGTVFKITPEGTLTTLYSFCVQEYCSDGAYPYAGLVQSPDGNFYGTTSEGGANNLHAGTVFKITPAGNLTTLYSFCVQTNCADGFYPTGTLVQGADGHFYGTTFSGGIGDAQYCNGGCGTVFKITPKGTFATLHSFAGYNTEGSGPKSGLAQSANGTLYGTTTGGGVYDTCSFGCGTVFKITPKGTLTTLHSFAGPPNDGAVPYASLVPADNGTFYGTTAEGGADANGTVFKITPAGKLTTIYNFCVGTNCADGGDPQARLVLATDGNLYGTAVMGGAYAIGSIFKITPQGALTTLYSFCAQGYPACPDGDLLYAGLMQATNGKLYASTSQGGDSNCDFGYGCGTIFSFSVGLRPFVETRPTSGKVGATVIILGTNLTGTTNVTFNGTAATFKVVSSSEITTKVPIGATTGTVEVTTPKKTLRSNVAFRVRP
jgi:uncharacterized repeat protein (TIGR03803 family)